MAVPKRKQNEQDMRQAEVLKQAKAVILSLLPDADVILYGSRARGESTWESDWDLLVLTDQPFSHELEFKLWDMLYPVMLECEAVISAFIRNRQEWSSPLSKASPYHQSIDRDGVII